ncbi:hypothetical protein [Marisediminicola sp. LYQ134]|uniref:hypothetical protein n=1 Tax=unclassified Marisediminicola TaxID=2618316 RepID=UPI00398336FF
MIVTVLLVAGIAALVGLPAAYAVRSWRPGKKPPRDRVQLVTSFVEVVFIAVAVKAVITANAPLPWWLWMIAVVAIAIGAAGAVLRWPTLPLTAPGASRRNRLIGGSLSVVLWAGLSIVLI